MAARQYYYAEAVDEQTTTSTSYVDALSLSFTPDASSTYFIIGSFQYKNRLNIKMIKSTATAATYNEFITKMPNTTDYWQSMALGVFTSGASPGSETFKIQYDAGAGTVAVKNVRLVAIKSNAADQYVEALSNKTFTTTSYADSTATMTFTPDSTGNYLILGAADVFNTNNTNQNLAAAQLVIDAGTSFVGGNGIEDTTSTNCNGWNAMIVSSLTNASHTIKIQGKNITASRTSTHRNSRLIALRLDTFDNNYNAQNAGRSTTTSNSYVDKTSLTQTPLNRYHIIFFGSYIDVGNSGGVTISTNFLETAITIHGTTFTPPNSGSYVGIIRPVGFYVKQLDASSTIWKAQLHNSDNSTEVGISNDNIEIIQLEATSTTNIKVVSGVVNASISKISNLARASVAKVSGLA